MLASVLACGHASSRPKSGTPAESSAPHQRHAHTSANGPIVGEYAVHYDGRGDLRVEALFAQVGARLAVESRADRFVDGLEVSADSDSAKWTPAGRDGEDFVANACATARCRVRYRYHLREAGRRLDNVDIASEEGEVLEAPPSTWLLAPKNGDANARIRFRVATAEGTRFETGVYRSHDVEDAWDIALGDLWTAPYSVFGPLRIRRVERGAKIDLAIGPGKLTVTDDELVTWTDDAARAIVGYFGRFPLPETLVIVSPGRGRWVGEGKTLSGGGGAIFVRVGERATARALHDDWVLVHEMVHLAFPSVAREHDWAEEGLATYVEPFARARAGLLTAEDAWSGLADGLPNGLPGPNDRGLDHTPTWGRTYWGGALF
ncbi:MAG: hypothetical protein K0S65_3211, partial [Labilithrix sp.]|nr:hypothetical protein [Labilithrix sp.]